MKRHIPNILTLGNLSAGCAGLVWAFNGQLTWAAYAIWVAALFDFLDGFVARLLKTSSPIGKELDSLADMVTFGVLPAAILYQLASVTLANWRWLAFLPALFAALRLAKFNIDTRQATGFIGMPTPAAAFLVSGLVFLPDGWLYDDIWLVIAVVVALLLVAPVRMLALKFSDYSFQRNWPRYLLVLAAAGMIIWLGAVGLTAAIVFYTLLSGVLHIVKWE